MSTPRRILSTAASTNQGPFSAGDWALFCAISMIWGSSFLLMDFGLDASRPGSRWWRWSWASCCAATG